MKRLITSLLVLAACGTVLVVYSGIDVSHIFDLLNIEKPPPRVWRSREVNDSPTYLVSFGGVKTVLSKKQLVKGYRLSDLTTGIRLPIKLYLNKNKVLIDARIYGKKENEIIATIKKNKWRKLPQGYKFNYSPNAFEIIGINDKPLLQVRIKAWDEIQFGGCFYKGGKKISITPESIYFYAKECRGEKIFEYSNSKNFGQTAKPENIDYKEKGFDSLSQEELARQTEKLIEKISALTCIGLTGPATKNNSKDHLAIENESVETYKKKYRNEALQIYQELFNRIKNKKKAEQITNQFIFREPAGFFGLSEIAFSLEYLKSRYVYNFSELDPAELKKRALKYAQALGKFLENHKTHRNGLCLYDRELKVEGIILLEEINARLPQNQKMNDKIKFLVLTKWTINHFQIIQMENILKLYANRLSP